MATSRVFNIFNRESWLWSFGQFAAVLAFVVANTSLIPEPYVETVEDIAMVLGFMAAKAGMSMMPYGGRNAQDPPDRV